MSHTCCNRIAGSRPPMHKQPIQRAAPPRAGAPLSVVCRTLAMIAMVLGLILPALHSAHDHTSHSCGPAPSGHEVGHVGHAEHVGHQHVHVHADGDEHSHPGSPDAPALPHDPASCDLCITYAMMHHGASALPGMQITAFVPLQIERPRSIIVVAHRDVWLEQSRPRGPPCVCA